MISLSSLVKPNPHGTIEGGHILVDALILCLVFDGGQGAADLLATATGIVEV